VECIVEVEAGPCARLVVSLKHTDVHYCDINSKVRYDVDALLLLLDSLRYARFG
jgi:hypothetical protein